MSILMLVYMFATLETHTDEGLQLRGLPRKAPGSTPPLAQKPPADSEDESTEDEEDLDVLPKSQSQSQSQPRTSTARSPLETSSPEPNQLSPPKSSSSIVQKSKGFRIGGAKSKTAVVESAPLTFSIDTDGIPKEYEEADVDAPVRTSIGASVEPTVITGAKAIRKPFKIGGKSKTSVQNSAVSPTRASNSKSVGANAKETSVEPTPWRNTPTIKTEVDISPVEEHEETAEEKAERKRQELKRKNEELAKKLAQNKKKKRF
jgi:hypothetical protein